MLTVTEFVPGPRTHCPAPLVWPDALPLSRLSWSESIGLWFVEPQGTAKVGLCLWHLLRICCSLPVLPFLTGFPAFFQILLLSGK